MIDAGNSQGDETAIMSDDENHSPRNKKRGRKPGTKPCERCKSQHLKCIYPENKSQCQRCEKAGHQCVRSTKKIRFRDVPMSRFEGAPKRKSKPVEQRPEPDDSDDDVNDAALLDQDNTGINIEHVSNDNGAQTDIGINGGIQPQDTQPNFPSFAASSTALMSNTSSIAENGIFGDSLASASMPPPSRAAGIPQTSISQSPVNLQRILSNERISISSLTSSPRRWTGRSASAQVLGHLVKHPSEQSMNPRSYTENILLRYFHEELAPWFDLCDPDRHFATVVPQRARAQGPLRSALLTISARNLSRNKRFRSIEGTPEWRGRALPELSEEFAVEYHNECIQVLSQLSEDPKKVYDETLLAAVVALRTDEELGYNVVDEQETEDQELFLRISGLFIDAQLPAYLALPHSSPKVFLPSSDDDSASKTSPSVIAESELGVSGLRQACFWTAFRQDLHASFLKQQPVRFPLSRCEGFRQLSPATDATWANRMVTFCADVLEFCYGSDSVDAQIEPAYTNQNRWHELKTQERSICVLLPSTFEPLYCCEADPALGLMFPEIWYLDPCHVSGTTYIELARMLLNVFDPTRPKLGHGFLAATNAFIQSTKKILFRLCGIALSNHHCPPSLINACLGISMFGEYFDDRKEQDALLGVLSLMNARHAYPTNQIANSLRRAWSCDEVQRSD